jgi:cation diffusion facilitator family transporter
VKKVKTKQKSLMIAGWISLISNLLLTLIKVGVGLLFKSPSLVADGVHNAVDVIASGAALGSMQISKRPADKEHPYGHGKAEVIASGMVAIILFLVAVMIIYESFESLFQPAVEAHWISLVAAVISLVWKQILYVYTIRVGKKTNSKGLIATAYDHLSDVYASLAAVIGISLALVGKHIPIPFTEYGDPLASIVVSLLILKVAIHLGKESMDILMEKNLPEEQMEKYKSLILKVPGVKRIDRIRAREHGHYILVDVRVSVPANLTIQEGHDIAREIKKSLMHAYNEIEEVLVHLNPWYGE